MTLTRKLTQLVNLPFSRLFRTNSLLMAKFDESVVSIDRFKCVHIDITELATKENATDAQVFQASLQESIKQWQGDGLRGVWCRVPLQQSELVPLLVKNEFTYHHAKDGHVTLVKWICDEPNNIPQYPYTNIGVGGIVIDSNNRVLVVKEKYFLGKKMWKFPGGYASQGENFSETAEREVFEETGVKAEFQSIVAFRHLHKFQFGGSDIYVVCHLKLQDGDHEVIKCPHEIEEARFIPIDELLPELSEFNRYVLNKYLFCKENGVSLGVEDVPFILGGKLNVYSLKQDASKL